MTNDELRKKVTMTDAEWDEVCRVDNQLRQSGQSDLADALSRQRNSSAFQAFWDHVAESTYRKRDSHTAQQGAQPDTGKPGD